MPKRLDERIDAVPGMEGFYPSIDRASRFDPLEGSSLTR